MAKDVFPVRGMRDFLPTEKAKREAVLSQILATYRSLGFQEIETPAVEELAKLTSGQGGDNEKLAYRVMRRGAELDAAIDALAKDGSVDDLADIGLRYDLTVPLTRYYASNRAKLPNVFKAIQTGPVWRAERPQKGRYRQFNQCDIDIIGDSSELAEIELLNASLDALLAIGLGAAVIRVNHRELLLRLLTELGVPSEGHGSAMITIDKLDKIAADGVTAELRDRFGDAVADKAASWLAGLGTKLPVPSELSGIFATVEARHPGKLRFDPTLVRGMGYYTGPIFEVEHPDSGSSIGGGGRYDGMVGRWLDTDVPAVGISIGFERAVDLVSLDSGEASNSVVLILDDTTSEVVGKALELQALLIAGGSTVRLEKRIKNLKSLLDSMAEQGFNNFATVNANSSISSLEIKPIG
jgi:histidyl-tRNA synthetase